MQALDDLVVLDLTHNIAGPYATRLLADYGADVIKVERPEGDMARGYPPFLEDEPGPERSGTFFYLNCNKRGVVLDLRTGAGKAALEALAKRADLVVESFAPGTLEKLGIGWDWFQSVNPLLPIVSISNFGQDGPYRDYRLTEVSLYGFAGEMYTMGEPDREPVKMAGTAAQFESGAAAATASLAAIFAAKRHGVAQRVDISMAETHFGGVDRRHATAIGYQFSGRKSWRASGAAGGMANGIFPCADGYVEFANSMIRRDRFGDMIGNPDWFHEPKFSDPLTARDPAIVEEFNALFLGWCLERTKREIWAEARRAKVLCGPLFTMEDLFEDENFRQRGFWCKVEHPVLGEVTIPGRPFLMAEGGWSLRRPAPTLGEHTEEVLREAGVDDAIVSEVLKVQGGEA